jgi:hypothetical protein
MIPRFRISPHERTNLQAEGKPHPQVLDQTKSSAPKKLTTGVSVVVILETAQAVKPLILSISPRLSTALHQQFPVAISNTVC